MGMTRAKRYANHKGGRKYEKTASGERGKEIEKSKGHEGMEEKERASQVFREVWEKCKAHEGYEELKERFLKEQREWVEMEGKAVKSEALEEDETNTDRKPRKKIKTENST